MLADRHQPSGTNCQRVMHSAALRAKSLDELCGIVREAVLLFVEHGIKRAQEMAATFLGLTVRRVRSYWQREVASVTEWEAHAIRTRRVALFEEQIAHHEAEAKRLTQAKEAANAELNSNRAYAARSDLAAACRATAAEVKATASPSCLSVPGGAGSHGC